MQQLDLAGILARAPQQLPRYTSYPPANHFTAEGGLALEGDFIAAVERADAVSAYVHIPFCDKLCWFCGCHTKHTLRYGPIAAYVQTLLRELSTWREKLAHRPRLARLHLGGGSPSLLQAADLVALRTALEATFAFTADTEISVEIDPTDVHDSLVAELVDFGMTRASIGVQDFDPVVQAAINRPQSFRLTAAVVARLRAAGVPSINIDALYGLPLQTPERLVRTVEQVISLQPDRIALFGYAHVPWLKSHQNMIRSADLPDAAARLSDSLTAAAMLVAAGYDAIGIDHFALKGDGLARAARAGRLHRNFQGYTVDDCSVLVPLGASSIGRYAGGYVQNEISSGRYAARVDGGGLALQRGLALTQDDVMRGYVIERLMCDFGFDYADVAKRFGPAVAPILAQAQAINAADAEGLTWCNGASFGIVAAARPLARLVAARFDSWLAEGAKAYSRAV